MLCIFFYVGSFYCYNKGYLYLHKIAVIAAILYLMVIYHCVYHVLTRKDKKDNFKFIWAFILIFLPISCLIYLQDKYYNIKEDDKKNADIS